MRISLAILAVVLIAGCVGQYAQTQGSQLTIQTAAGPVSLNVEIADSESERAQGFMGRTSLAQDSGMLFVFDDGEKPRSFWMKNTLIPLDIMFISAGKEIIDIQTMVPCASDPCPFYTSRAPAAYALETNAGFASANGIEIGDSVLFSS